MADEKDKQAKDESQEQANQEQDTTQDVDTQAQETIEEKIEKALADQQKKWKAEIDGLNRKNNELNKKLKDAELEKLSEEERIKAELEEAREEKKKVEQEASQFRRQLTVEKMVRKYNLPENFSNRLQGNDESEIEADAQSIAEFLSGEVQRRASEDVNKKLSGKPPQGGKTSDTSGLQAQYDAAKERNDVAAMLSLSQQASREGEKLKEF